MAKRKISVVGTIFMVIGIIATLIAVATAIGCCFPAFRELVVNFWNGFVELFKKAEVAESAEAAIRLVPMMA